MNFFACKRFNSLDSLEITKAQNSPAPQESKLRCVSTFEQPFRLPNLTPRLGSSRLDSGDRINWRFSASASITRRFLARYEIIEVGK